MINWAKLLPKRSFKLHFHEDMKEVFIIITGKVKVRSENQTEIVCKGDVVIIPEKERHQMWNLSQSDAEYIVIGISGQTGGKTIV